MSLPAWFDPARVILEINVANLLATGEHPLPRVQAALAAAAPGAQVLLHSSFEPAPLLDVMRSLGLDAWCGRNGDSYRTLILKG